MGVCTIMSHECWPEISTNCLHGGTPCGSSDIAVKAVFVSDSVCDPCQAQIEAQTQGKNPIDTTTIHPSSIDQILRSGQ